MGRNRNNTDSPHYIDWLDKAEDDINASRILKNCGGDNEVIAFHCQQAIEKALKGYLLYKKSRHFDGHNLTFLCKQAIMCDEAFRQWYDESIALNRYYIETRYPADIPLEITNERIDAVYNMATQMFIFIEKEMEEAKYE